MYKAFIWSHDHDHYGQCKFLYLATNVYSTKKKKKYVYMCSSIFHACLYCNKSHFIFFFHCTELCSYIKIKILCKRTSLLYSTWVWLDYSCWTTALAITQHTWHGNGEEASKARYGYVIYNRRTITTWQCDMVPSVALLIKLMIEWVPSSQQVLITKKPWHMKHIKVMSAQL